MTWQEVCDDKSLRDLPYKIELDKWGRIVMSPASNRRAQFLGRITVRLERSIAGGETLTECSVETPLGVKVPDVAWASGEFLSKYGHLTPYPAAPEICVEVTSPSNSGEAIREKIMLYLSKGAREVWICDSEGKIAFHDSAGTMKRSILAPKFPLKI